MYLNVSQASQTSWVYTETHPSIPVITNTAMPASYLILSVSGISIHLTCHATSLGAAADPFFLISSIQAIVKTHNLLLKYTSFLSISCRLLGGLPWRVELFHFLPRQLQPPSVWISILHIAGRENTIQIILPHAWNSSKTPNSVGVQSQILNKT